MQPHPRVPVAQQHRGRRSAGRRGVAAFSLLPSVAAAILMRLPVLALPLERDEGAYAYIAALWLHGGLPYRDVFDHKPPLLYLLYMPAIIAAMPGAISVRLWSSLLFLIELPLVFLLARHVWDGWSAALATLLYAVAGSTFSLQGLIFNSEQALVLPALVALWALCKAIETPSWRWPVLYGICLGLVALIKPTAIPLLLPLILLARMRGMRGHLSSLALAAAGTVLPWIPMLALWGAAGAWNSVVFALITYNRLYASESVRRWSGAALIDTVAPLGPLLVCALGGIALAGWGGPRRRQRTAIVLWTGAMLGAAILGLRPYIHYYYPALPGLALLTAPVVTMLVRNARRARTSWQRIAAMAAPLALLTILMVPPARDNLHMLGKSPAQQAEALYGIDGREYFGPAAAVAARIMQKTKKGEKIFVWASEPEIYVLSGRMAAARYIYVYPLELVPTAQQALIDQLQRNPPALFVLYHGFMPAGFEELARRQGLQQSATIGGYDIWAASGRAAR